MQLQKRRLACRPDWGNSGYCDECLDTENCPAETRKANLDKKKVLEHATRRVYEDFAKKRQEIEHMPEGKRKAKALHIWYILAELVSCNWEGTGANP